MQTKDRNKHKVVKRGQLILHDKFGDGQSCELRDCISSYLFQRLPGEHFADFKLEFLGVCLADVGVIVAQLLTD